MAPKIQAPNGDVYDMPDATVSGLLGGSPANGWKAVETPPNGEDDGSARTKATGGSVPGGKPTAKPRKPAKTASLEKWVEYAAALDVAVPVGADVEAVKAAVDAHGKAPAKADADTGKTADSEDADNPTAGDGDDENADKTGE